MRRRSLAQWPCPIARAADQLGDTWTLVILRDVSLGKRRFVELQQALPIAPNMLTRRLSALVEHGLVEAQRYSASPNRFEYHLTEKGADALPVLLTLAAWGNRWLAPKGAPLTIVDGSTQRVVDPVVVDARTGKRLVAGKVGVKAGPGAPKSIRNELHEPVVFQPATSKRKST